MSHSSVVVGFRVCIDLCKIRKIYHIIRLLSGPFTPPAIEGVNARRTESPRESRGVERDRDEEKGGGGAVDSTTSLCLLAF